MISVHLIGFLIGIGLIAGFIDSIAGGGGLITLPAISLVVGVGATAIGTNKICGLAAAFAALVVYARQGHFEWRKSIAFTVANGVGAVVGSRVTPMLPPTIFPWFLAVTCPIILYCVWRKDLWSAHAAPNAAPSPWLVPAIVFAGLACGFYDGLWGPGSGTFMFLSLVFIARMPLLSALAVSKMANGVSDLVALGSYANQGRVHPTEGILVALGAIVGGWYGARQANARAAQIVRPILVGVVALLVVKVVSDYITT